MLERPRLKSHYAVGIVEPAMLFLMSEHAEQVFQGEAFVAIAPLLDGRRTMGEVVAEASSKVPLPALFSALAQLEAKKCLAEGEAPAEAQAGAFWDAIDVPAENVAPALSAGLRVEGIGVDAAPVERALIENGVTLTDGAAFRLVVVGDYLDPALAGVNRSCLEAERPWALTRVHGTVAWVGPVFRPGITACWECLARRLATNRQVEHYLHVRAERAILTRPRAWLPASVAASAAWAAAELTRALVAGPGRGLDGKILTFDFRRRALEEHAVVQRPQCAACGDPGLGDPARAAGPIVLESRARPDGAHGRERLTSAAETYERYKHLVSPLSGVVVSLVPREPGEQQAHNYVAGHYYPVTSRDLSGLRINLLARSGGKGRSPSQARTSALCEAIERYSGIAWGEEPRRRASATALGAEAVPIRQLALFSEAQYKSRESSPAASEFHEVPPPLADDVEISWSPAWSLTHGRVRYLPTAYCYYGFRDPGVFFTRCDSNGNAAGNSLEEAILYGFLELVERDAVALWWYNRARRPEIDASRAGISYWEEMKRHYARELRRDLHALDLTTDLGIPVVAVVSRRQGRAVEDVIVGFAAHLDPEVALLRAVEEANQYLPSVREEAEDGSTIYRLYSEETVRWWRSATFENQPYLVPDPSAPARRFEDLPRLSREDLREDVETCVAAAARCGLEVLVLDQTRPDIGLPVVKVVVPGLRHFWRRLGAGRLYDVPVKLGWIEQPRREDEMNPISCFV
jgi:ribosomal protein S12 methylthiotransferase accessory factor